MDSTVNLLLIAAVAFAVGLAVAIVAAWLVVRARAPLPDLFRLAAGDALAANSRAFLEAAREKLALLQADADNGLAQREESIARLVQPVHESLARVESHVRELEKAREQAYGAVLTEVRLVAQTHERLQRETGNLVRALRAPQTRGRWGELQLRRAVELAGMIEHCDFDEQVTIWRGEQSLRPDMIVHLPGGKEVVVDAKAPLLAYLDAVEASDDEQRTALLRQHARQVAEHVRKLAAKSYWDHFSAAPDFVVLFLPGETFFSAALAEAPDLFEEAFAKNIVLASPTTLIALLKSVSYGWQQEAVAANARLIGEAARELHNRLQIFTEHLAGVGKGLTAAVNAYNKAVSSFEARLLPQGRRFEELEAAPAAAFNEPPAVVAVPRLPANATARSETDGAE